MLLGSLNPSVHGSKRVLRILSIASAFAAIACSDRATNTTEGALGEARFSISPSFQALPPGVPSVALTRVHGLLIGPLGDSIVVDANFVGDSAVMSFDVRFPGTSATFKLDLSAFDDHNVVAFRVTQDVTLQSGNNLLTPQLVYAAPDAGVTKLTVAPQKVTLSAGATSSATATGTSAAGQAISPIRLAWSTSDSSIVTIDSTGAIKAGQFQGLAYVIARTVLGVSDSELVTVHAPVDHINITPSPLQVIRGLTNTATAELRDRGNHLIDDRTATFSTSDASIATISAAGVITGIKTGTATITATAEGKIGTAVVTVLSPIDHIEVSPSSLSFASLGEVQTVTARIVPRTGATVTGFTPVLSSSNPAIARLDTGGRVTAISNGTATIKASADGVDGTATVTVLQIAQSLAISPKAAGVTFLGDKRTFIAIASDALGSPLTATAIAFKSSDSTVVTIDAAGVATAVGVGSATITATSGTKSDVATFTVVQTPSSISITTDKKQILVGGTTQLTARLVDAGGSPVNSQPAFTWASQSPTIASVSASGVVTGIASGTAFINATGSGLVSSISIVVGSSTSTSVNGSVSDGNTLTALSGAVITSSLGTTALTGPGGGFLLANVTPGSTLTITATGYIGAKYVNVPFPSSSSSSTPTVLIGNIPLAPVSSANGTIQGRVIDVNTDGAVPGARVTFYAGANQTTGSPAIQAFADSIGTYTVSLPAGTYTAIAGASGYVSDGQLVVAAVGGATKGNQNLTIVGVEAARAKRASRPAAQSTLKPKPND